MNAKQRLGLFTTLLFVMFSFGSGLAVAHCDSEDGPIIPSIRKSLDNGDVTPLLKWVAADDESEIKELFLQVRKVRSTSDDARDIADQLFIETFIRIHRAGEGASFTGIQPAGSTPPIYAAADQALKSGDIDDLAEGLANEVRDEVVQRFKHALSLSKHQDESVAAGRQYVAAYVSYMHLVEGLQSSLGTHDSEHHIKENAHDEH